VQHREKERLVLHGAVPSPAHDAGFGHAPFFAGRHGVSIPSDVCEILYVEDNPELRETIGMLMEGEGRTVTPCATAEEALALDAGDVFDVVVTDVSLPGLSGTELARQLLADDPQRWVVLCSGYELGSHPRSWGPNVRALLKPFELEELEHLLESIHTALASAAS
jgi:two-component system cell cycle response regulator CpdR